MATASWSYTFSTNLTEPPTGNQIRFDAAWPYIAVVKVWIRNLTNDGIDIHVGLMNIAASSTLYIQDKNDHTLYASFTTTGPAVDKVDYVHLPVTWVANGTTALLNQAVELVVLAPETSPPTPPTDGPALLTLEEAKRHLGITWSEDDALVTEKLEAASDIIRDVLQDADDSAWTSATVPKRIKAATYLMLGHLYAKHRGDAPETDEQLHASVWRLLERDRAPILA